MRLKEMQKVVENKYGKEAFVEKYNPTCCEEHNKKGMFCVSDGKGKIGCAVTFEEALKDVENQFK
jgi:hypothetical protein